MTTMDSAQLQLFPPGLREPLPAGFVYAADALPGAWNLVVRCEHGKRLRKMLVPGKDEIITAQDVKGFVIASVNEFVGLQWGRDRLCCFCGLELLHRYGQAQP